MALMLKVCDMREMNSEGDRRYRYLTGRIDDQTRLILMPNRKNPEAGEWTLFVVPTVSRDTAEPDDLVTK